jgi:glutamate-ammonia-ligase adenylyltransferase
MRLLGGTPEAALERILADCGAIRTATDIDLAAGRLRELKSELHLLAALADLGGVWETGAVTAALSRFADEAVATAIHLAAAEAVSRGRLASLGDGEDGPVPGFFIVAMGKHGAFELNYSSDIDLMAFYEPEALPLVKGQEPQQTAVRLVERMAELLQSRTDRGYVFRVDLRLRPDPSSTPVAVAIPWAFGYYESVGQNWERAALIKARAAAGDLNRGRKFLAELSPFIWRRHLDFAAIADIHSIKRQIHTYKVDDRLSAAGAELKLGRGGIREIEFFVQTQQLILGGRHPELRSPSTLSALKALSAAGHVGEATAVELAKAYDSLRRWEHRVQMIADEQTHRLPAAADARRRIAALSGCSTLKAFDAAVTRTLRLVNRHYGALFAGEEALSSRQGSLVFTGVDEDPETLATLRRMGFSNPEPVSATIRSWHHGLVSAGRSARGRELLTRLAPRLLEAAAATGAPNIAFVRFADFFARLSGGVQVQSLFLAQPALLALIVRIMAYAPRFSATLARSPAALDALFDPGFFAPIAPPLGLADRIAAAGGFEEAMDVARRGKRDLAFQIAVQVLEGRTGPEAAGAAFADLADAVIEGLARATLAEIERRFGRTGGEIAVVALGKCGSREMTAQSDLDLMTLYTAPPEARWSSPLAIDTYCARFTQRLIAALSTHTSEGGLYDVDMQLRPSGTKGPVAVSLEAFKAYYAGEAETWEFLALTRGRVVWATSEGFARTAGAVIEKALRQSRDASATAKDVREMRALMAVERPPDGFWDMKLSRGGLVDIEFAAQYLQLRHAAEDGPLHFNTAAALARLAGWANPEALEPLMKAWRLQQGLSQLLKIALEDDADPEREPRALRGLLVKAGEARDFRALKAKLRGARQAALLASRAATEGD